MDNKSILLVDDENINHILAKRILGGMYRLVSAYSGSEAVALAKQETPDLVLMDILMPETDGFETLRLMREQESLAGVPVVFLTSKEDDATKERCIEAGAKAFVTKPFVPGALKQTLRDILDERT